MRFFFLLAFTFIGFFHSLDAEEIPITLEIAQSHEQRAWGLMRRTSLPEDHGMLFYHPRQFIWMFNTWIDLSVAFLDEKGIILEIVELQAHPEMMDPLRPVNNPDDMRKYPGNDKVIQFFVSKSWPVPSHAKYALEMNKHWFDRHGIKTGDKVIWDVSSSKGYVKK